MSSTEDESAGHASPEEEMAERIINMKDACLRQAKVVTGLQGRTLAITLRKTTEGEWYAALKDTGANKYLKLWMNRNKTFPTQIEALQAYFVFVKKMKTDCRLFPMSPRTNKTK
ncbi:uncharacterized protein K460DRAFT_62099 [Cucurbitaria berberidis CBS 394.84]|uniref:Uncharacterized protein n=1 Tax=Cucurbitaria berberidis CBS 394.84 TaxID=1168544 RepID=A0A9P4L9U3_9PLEO|nr:uncharacterized protein K460DRAFT_62099 [Cucurbitaria berberidis CBS 394.84]KAF1847626.1 hypothetical protein K460DRAFT_62099 [Cucurbitaria berberidis CBS 394.84]